METRPVQQDVSDCRTLRSVHVCVCVILYRHPRDNQLSSRCLHFSKPYIHLSTLSVVGLYLVLHYRRLYFVILNLQLPHQCFFTKRGNYKLNEEMRGYKLRGRGTEFWGNQQTERYIVMGQNVSEIKSQIRTWNETKTKKAQTGKTFQIYMPNDSEVKW